MNEQDLLNLARGLSSATVHEAAGRIGALPSAIKPFSPEVSICGRAFPVKSPTGDNLFLHHAIYAASPGEILVADCGGADEFGYWGEVMAVAAKAIELGGLVISGGVRDSWQMHELGFPVFAGNICIRGTGKDPSRAGSVGHPIMIGDVSIRRGDLIIGDADGVVVIPWLAAEEVVRESVRRDEKEQEIFKKLRSGITTVEVYGLPALQALAGDVSA